MDALKILLTSMLPVLELRAAIPLGILLGMSPLKTYLISVLGNFLPVPFLLIFLRRVLEFLENFEIFSPVLRKIYEIGDKRSEIVRRYGPLGLMLFVAIPLPVTGAWTGSLIAVLLNLPPRDSMISIFLGILVAGTIVTMGSLGVFTLF